MPELAIQLEGVNKTYRHFALQNVSFQLPAGTIMGFIGANGAGKSTTLRIAMGLVHQDAGSVQVLGHELPRQHASAKWDIGFVSEDMRLYGGATVAWHMRFLQSIFPRWDQPYAETLVKRFDLRPEQKIKGLSHGQRVKAAMLLALARRPRLLILDEPTTGLDPVARHELLRELLAFISDEDRSILFSSQNTLDVEQISDHITFIDRGRVIDSDDKESFLDRWRRVRLETPPGITLPAVPGVVETETSGRLAVVTTRSYEPAVAMAYQSAGATVQAVDKMTLEEIFVANVMTRRKQEAL